jgi:hypothetical protein
LSLGIHGLLASCGYQHVWMIIQWFWSEVSWIQRNRTHNIEETTVFIFSTRSTNDSEPKQY